MVPQDLQVPAPDVLGALTFQGLWLMGCNGWHNTGHLAVPCSQHLLWWGVISFMLITIRTNSGITLIEEPHELENKQQQKSVEHM